VFFDPGATSPGATSTGVLYAEAYEEELAAEGMMITVKKQSGGWMVIDIDRLWYV
jgi:hypothetical protein